MPLIFTKLLHCTFCSLHASTQRQVVQKRAACDDAAATLFSVFSRWVPAGCNTVSRAVCNSVAETEVLAPIELLVFFHGEL